MFSVKKFTFSHQKFHQTLALHLVYKLVTKVIANRLKPLLPQIISDTQGALTEGCSISNNILIAFEILHALGDLTSWIGCMPVKLDMSKAFERVEWPFLANIMLKLGFCQQWVSLVLRCIKSASFSFLINKVPRGHIIPSRGIRQKVTQFHLTFSSFA